MNAKQFSPRPPHAGPRRPARPPAPPRDEAGSERRRARISLCGPECENTDAARASAEALAELVKADPECMVRVRAVESLGLLKLKPEAVELAKKDSKSEVQWIARMAAGQIRS